ncbi:efflux RND transporter periplasmic adaptor subunit [Rubellicoccus peritrichatus]|uniref:Efflux RND transporter periplasmic adaptor subunit n=1 Tax=Rubellicoccus peritrichatus TaxID=3080537 RepID=A0AAQ3QWC0_9BACT|nr:efflux RND transporter periplasmic adaptor subunit [Puniceicoccus sp. CR14]WOO41730.1 efflux RND transporter periplasmic adaptor subunit [Puniceicoccus sp. CR14]
MPPSVTIATAVSKDVPIYLTAIGYTTAFEEVEVMTQVDGQLMAIHFEQGTEVKAGDLLFTIDQRPYKAVLEEAEGNLRESIASLEINQLAVNRNRPLLGQNLISQQDFDALQAAVEESLGMVQMNEAAVVAARINLDFCSIRSPIDGLIDIYEVNAGNVLFADNQTDLTSIRRIDPLYVDFVISERDLPELQKAIKAASPKPLELEVSLMTNAKVKRTAKLEVVGNTIQRNAGVARLRGIMKNEDQRFWPGESINVRIILRTEKNATVIPEECIQLGQRGYSIFVVNKDNTVEHRFIKLGERLGSNVIVKSGLKKGERVVLSGQIMLKPKSKVTIVKPPSETTNTSSQASSSSKSSASSSTDSDKKSN